MDLLHEQRVVKEKSDRVQRIDDFVQKGIRDQQTKWEQEKQTKALNDYHVKEEFFLDFLKQIL